MDKWECTVCGYVYDPAEGDPDGGVDAGTAFEDIPDSWFCPNCGVGKEFFKKQDYPGSRSSATWSRATRGPTLAWRMPSRTTLDFGVDAPNTPREAVPICISASS